MFNRDCLYKFEVHRTMWEESFALAVVFHHEFRSEMLDRSTHLFKGLPRKMDQWLKPEMKCIPLCIMLKVVKSKCLYNWQEHLHSLRADMQMKCSNEFENSYKM